MKKVILLHKKAKEAFIACLAILVVLSVTLIMPALIDAAGVTIITVTMVDGSGNNVSSAASTVATMTIIFDPETEVNTDDGINIHFESDFDISNVVNGDVALSQTNSGTNITKGTAAVSGQNLQITIGTESDTPDGQITVTISNSHITTPTSDGTYTITVTTYDLGDDGAFGGSDGNADTLEDTGASAVIIGDNVVIISGTVDPTLTLNLYNEGTTDPTSTCGLGVLYSDRISTCSYDVVVTTNATNGYSAYIREDGPMTNSSSDTLDAVADADITPTATSTEEYGVAIKTTDTLGSDASALTQYNSGGKTCTDSTPTGWSGETSSALSALGLSTSDKEFVTHATSGVDGSTNGLTTLCHAAAIAGDTEAGIYTHTITITAVGNF